MLLIKSEQKIVNNSVVFWQTLLSNN